MSASRTEGLYPGGGSASRVSASRGGLHPEEVCIQGGWAESLVCLRGGLDRGGWADPPRHTWDITGYGQQAGGTHPTGMLSCLKGECSIFLKS